MEKTFTKLFVKINAWYMHKGSDAFTIHMHVHFKSRYKTYSSGLQRQTTVTIKRVKERDSKVLSFFFLAKCVVGSYFRYSYSICYLDLTDNHVIDLMNNSKYTDHNEIVLTVNDSLLDFTVFTANFTALVRQSLSLIYKCS